MDSSLSCWILLRNPSTTSRSEERIPIFPKDQRNDKVAEVTGCSPLEKMEGCCLPLTATWNIFQENILHLLTGKSKKTVNGGYVQLQELPPSSREKSTEEKEMLPWKEWEKKWEEGILPLKEWEEKGMLSWKYLADKDARKNGFSSWEEWRAHEARELSNVEQRYREPCERLLNLRLEELAVASFKIMEELSTSKNAILKKWLSLPGPDGRYEQAVSTILGVSKPQDTTHARFLWDTYPKVILSMQADESTRESYSAECQLAIQAFRDSFDQYQSDMHVLRDFHEKEDYPLYKRVKQELKKLRLRNAEIKGVFLDILKKLFPNENPEVYFTDTKKFVSDMTEEPSYDFLHYERSYLEEDYLNKKTHYFPMARFQRQDITSGYQFEKRRHVFKIIEQMKYYRFVVSLEGNFPKI